MCRRWGGEEGKRQMGFLFHSTAEKMPLLSMQRDRSVRLGVKNGAYTSCHNIEPKTRFVSMLVDWLYILPDLGRYSGQLTMQPTGIAYMYLPALTKGYLELYEYKLSASLAHVCIRHMQDIHCTYYLCCENTFTSATVARYLPIWVRAYLLYMH